MRASTSIEVIFILCVVSIVALTRYVFVPLRLRRTHWLATDAEIQPVDPAQWQPERVEAYLKRVVDVLRPVDEIGAERDDCVIHVPHAGFALEKVDDHRGGRSRGPIHQNAIDPRHAL